MPNRSMRSALPALIVVAALAMAPLALAADAAVASRTYVVTSGDFTVLKDGSPLGGSPFASDKAAIDAAVADALDGDRIELAQRDAATPFIYAPGTLSQFNKSLTVVGRGELPRITGGVATFDVRTAAGKSLEFRNLWFENNVTMAILLRQVKDCAIIDCRFTCTSGQRFAATSALNQKFWRGILIGNNAPVDFQQVTGDILVSNCYFDAETDPGPAAVANRAALDPAYWQAGFLENRYPEDTGSATSTSWQGPGVGTGTLVDLSKSWGVGAFARDPVAGHFFDLLDSAGVIRPIIANTATQVTVTPRAAGDAPAAGSYTIIRKPWHTGGPQPFAAGPTSRIRITGCTIKNMSMRGIHSEDTFGEVEIDDNVIDLGPYGGHALGSLLSSTGILITVAQIFTVGDKGRVSVHDNTVICRGRDQFGITVAGGNGTTEALSIARNEVILDGFDFGGQRVDCFGGLGLQGIDNGLVALNRIRGASKYGLSIGRFAGRLIGTDNNVFLANSMRHVKTSIADVLFTGDADGNTVIGGAAKTYIDEGYGNRITGLTPLRIITGRITAVKGDSIADGETFTLDDGRSLPVVFEFDKDGAVAAGRTRVAITDALTVAQVGAAVAGAINALNPAGGTAVINLRASQLSPFDGSAVDLYHTDVASRPRPEPIAEAVADPGFLVEGMRYELGVGRALWEVIENLQEADMFPQPDLGILGD